MKKTFLKTLLISIAAITLIAFYSYFHSIVSNVAFIVTLDQILSTIISELWKFISTPTIFIASLVIIILWLFRKNISAIFPAIKQIKAGSFSATIDYSDISKSVSESQTSSDVQNKIELTDEFLDVITRQFGEKTWNFLLDIDDKILTLDDHVARYKKIAYLFEDEDSMNEFEKAFGIDSLRIFYYGVFKMNGAAFRNLLFDVKISENLMSGSYTLKPKFRHKLEARLKEIEQEKTSK
ncbi:MAG: hypothetical protein MUO30_05955 [Anaerolineales bacterium]|nr:hypothetical protein [Anaerolineales bacterium]